MLIRNGFKCRILTLMGAALIWLDKNQTLFLVNDRLQNLNLKGNPSGGPVPRRRSI